MTDLMLAALLGFVVGVLWQEIHFRKVTAQIDDLAKRMEDL